MARGINKVILIGNLGNDPDTRYLTDGSAVTNISLATSETWKDRNTGEQNERTEWHRCSAFGRLAEIMGEYLRKGSKVYIEGSLYTRQYEKEGQKHYATEIKVKDMQMLDSRGDSNSQYAGNGGYSHANTGGNASLPPPEDFDDDIPF